MLDFITLPAAQQELLNSIQRKLSGLQSENRLLFECEFSEFDREQIVYGVRNLPRLRYILTAHEYIKHWGLLPFTAFSMFLTTEHGDDTIYHLLNQEFNLNLTDENWRVFINGVCASKKMKVIHGQNNLWQQTLYLHAGIPSHHFTHFFELILSKININGGIAEVLESLLTQLTLPKSIWRFFHYGGDSARQFLADCLEMRDAIDRGEDITVQELGVSNAIFDAYRDWLDGRRETRRMTTSFRCLDEGKGAIVIGGTTNITPPQTNEKLLFFRQNNREIRSENRLPATWLWCVAHRSVSLLPDFERCITHDRERLSGAWKEYYYFGLDLRNEAKIEFTTGNGVKEFILLSQINCDILPEGLVLANGRPVEFIWENNESSYVYNKLPKISITGGTLEQVKQAGFFLSEFHDVNRKQPIPSTSELVYEAENAIILDLQRVHETTFPLLTDCFFRFWLSGAIRGTAVVSLYHCPSLKEVRFDKEYYEANEGGAITIDAGESSVNLQFPPSTETSFLDGYNVELRIPIPRKQWRISGGIYNSQPLIIPIDTISSAPNNSFLELCLPLADGEKVRITEVVTGRSIPIYETRILNGKLSLDFAVLYNHAINKTVIIRAEYRFAGRDEWCELLRIYRKWKPENLKIFPLPDNSKQFVITFEPSTFRERRLLLWNTNAPWELPIIVEIPDSDDSAEIICPVNGRYVVQPDTTTPNEWGIINAVSKYAIPTEGYIIDTKGDYLQNDRLTDELIDAEQWDKLALLFVYHKRCGNYLDSSGIENYTFLRNSLAKIKEEIRQLSTLDETVINSYNMSFGSIELMLTEAEQRLRNERERRSERERQQRLEQELQQYLEQERLQRIEKERCRLHAEEREQRRAEEREQRREEERQRRIEKERLAYNTCQITIGSSKSVANITFNIDNEHGTLIFQDRQIDFNVKGIISRIKPDARNHDTNYLKTATIEISGIPPNKTIFLEVLTKPPYLPITCFTDLLKT